MVMERYCYCPAEIILRGTCVPYLTLYDFAVWKFLKFAGELDSDGWCDIFLADVLIAFDYTTDNVGFSDAGVSHKNDCIWCKVLLKISS
jgi:hypothetical protein